MGNNIQKWYKILSFFKPSLTQFVVRGLYLARVFRQLEAVDEEFVSTDGEEDVVHVEEPGHVDRLGVEGGRLPGSLPAARLHQDSPAAPVPDLQSAIKYRQISSFLILPRTHFNNYNKVMTYFVGRKLP